MSTLGEDYNLTMGHSPPGSTYNEVGDGLPFYQGRKDFGFRYPSLRVYCSHPKRLGQKDDNLVSVRAPVGDVNMALDRCCVGRGVAAVRHKTGSRSYTYYSILRLKEVLQRFEKEGTVLGAINKTDFEQLAAVSPNRQIVERFEALVYPIDQLIEANSRQIDSLVNCRDNLLPKLLSGEIRVKNAERFVEGAM